MVIELNPKLEEMARQDASAAGYASVRDYLEDLLTEQHTAQQWVVSDPDSMDAKIEEALASEGKGLDLTPEDAALELEARLRRHFAAGSVA